MRRRKKAFGLGLGVAIFMRRRRAWAWAWAWSSLHPLPSSLEQLLVAHLARMRDHIIQRLVAGRAGAGGGGGGWGGVTEHVHRVVCMCMCIGMGMGMCMCMCTSVADLHLLHLPASSTSPLHLGLEIFISALSRRGVTGTGGGIAPLEGGAAAAAAAWCGAACGVSSPLAGGFDRGLGGRSGGHGRHGATETAPPAAAAREAATMRHCAAPVPNIGGGMGGGP